MSPLFVVQEIPDRDIPEEMKIYKEKTGRKTVKRTKKLLSAMKAKKILLHPLDSMVSAAWLEVDSGLSID